MQTFKCMTYFLLQYNLWRSKERQNSELKKSCICLYKKFINVKEAGKVCKRYRVAYVTLFTSLKGDSWNGQVRSANLWEPVLIKIFLFINFKQWLFLLLHFILACISRVPSIKFYKWTIEANNRVFIME